GALLSAPLRPPQGIADATPARKSAPYTAPDIIAPRSFAPARERPNRTPNMRLSSEFSIAVGISALAACAPRYDERQEAVRGSVFTGVHPAAPDPDDRSCPEAAFPGGASLENNRRDGATMFFCEH